MLDENIQLLLIGAGIGLVCAIFGAAIDYVVTRGRRAEDDETRLPGCMLLMTGALGFMGLVTLSVSFVFYLTIWPAVWIGAGVMLGFFIGFSVLFLISVFIASRRSNGVE